MSCFVALLFGHLGFSAPPGASGLGFAVFIFSIGLQAGPSFFSAFAADGLRYLTLACLVAVTAFVLSLVLARSMGLEYGFGAGMLAGALTSSPTLAGAQDAVKSGLAALPEAVPQAKAMENVGVGYAITYVFGTLGMILVARLFPRIVGIDLPAEAAKLERERGLGGGAAAVPGGACRLSAPTAYRRRWWERRSRRSTQRPGTFQARC